MTEAEWLTDKQLDRLLGHVHNSVSPRKLRLFACACCRRLWPIVDSWCHLLCALAERHAEGEATAAEVSQVAQEAGDPDWTAALAFEEAASFGDMLEAASNAAGNAAFAWADDVARDDRRGSQFESVRAREQERQCHLLRDVVGNPFRRVAIEQPWLDWREQTVVKLAQVAYEERAHPSGELDPGRLTIVADALEEAGCTRDDLLGHLRGPGPHLRGCWAVDLLLEKD
ncbi:MAG: hypothetical protein AB7K24_05305 [Gemmataceae bacterium]